MPSKIITHTHSLAPELKDMITSEDARSLTKFKNQDHMGLGYRTHSQVLSLHLDLDYLLMFELQLDTISLHSVPYLNNCCHYTHSSQ